MSANEILKQSAKTSLKLPALERAHEMNTVEAASYVVAMVRGVRALTRHPNRKEMRFLDYILAIAEDEASTLSSRIYH